MSVGTPLSMAKAPVAARPTQQARSTVGAASAQKWKGAPGRSLATGGVFGKMGQLPQVASVGGGKTTRAAALPTPLPIPGGGGMTNFASVRDTLEGFNRRNIDLIKESVWFEKVEDVARAGVNRMGKRRRRYRSPEELMSVGRDAPAVATSSGAAPPVIPPPSVKRSAQSADDSLFDWET